MRWSLSLSHSLTLSLSLSLSLSCSCSCACACVWRHEACLRGGQEKTRKLRLVASNARKIRDAEAEVEAALNKEPLRAAALSCKEPLVRKVTSTWGAPMPRCPNQPEIGLALPLPHPA